MAYVRGNWFEALRIALEELGALGPIERALPAATLKVLGHTDPLAWHDEVHAVAVYDALARSRGLSAVRSSTRLAARKAMQTSWRPLVAPLIRLYVGKPEPAFAQLPMISSAIRRDGGVLTCLPSDVRSVVTELRGCPHVVNPAWREAWFGLHEALLRELRVGGSCTLIHLEERTQMVRARTAWAFALAGAPTEGSLART